MTTMRNLLQGTAPLRGRATTEMLIQPFDSSRVQPAVLACPSHRTSHELDVVVTTVNPGAADSVVAIGEAKWRDAPVGLAQLERLDHLRDLLPGHPAAGPRLLLFASSGFTDDVIRTSRSRRDVALVDLDRLYRGN